MKKFLILLPILSVLIISGCRTTKIEIELPPKPVREEIEAPKDLKGIAELLNYYEHKLQEWEAWGTSVEAILTNIEK